MFTSTFCILFLPNAINFYERYSRKCMISLSITNQRNYHHSHDMAHVCNTSHHYLLVLSLLSREPDGPSLLLIPLFDLDFRRDSLPTSIMFNQNTHEFTEFLNKVQLQSLYMCFFKLLKLLPFDSLAAFSTDVVASLTAFINNVVFACFEGGTLGLKKKSK